MRFSIATTADQVHSLRPVWREMGPAELDSDADYLLTVAAHARQVISPYVVHITRTGQPDLLVVARLENLPVRIRLAYRVVAQPCVRAIVVTFGGVLGARGAGDCDAVMEVFGELLDAGRADMVLMRNIDPAGSLFGSARQAGGLLRFARWQRRDPLWSARVPDSLDAFLAGRSSKTRSSFRREERLLRESFGARLALRCLMQPDELETICRDMASVACRTYQAGLGAGFADTPMERALVALALSRSCFRCWMLYVDDQPIAFWSGTRHGRTFFPNTPGFDPAFADHSVGRYTMFRMIEQLCREGTLDRIDFGRGDAQYKLEFAVPERAATDVWLAARRPRAMALVAALSMSAGFDHLARDLVERSDMGRSLKSRWRRRLAARAAKAAG